MRRRFRFLMLRYLTARGLVVSLAWQHNVTSQNKRAASPSAPILKVMVYPSPINTRKHHIGDEVNFRANILDGWRTAPVPTRWKLVGMAGSL